MDLSKYAQNDTCIVNLLDPITGEKLDASIEVYSKDTKQYRKLTTQIAKGDFNHDDSAVFMLASLTKGWTNIENNGQKLECTLENASMIYSEYAFIYDQLERVIFDRVKFLKVQPKNS